MDLLHLGEEGNHVVFVVYLIVLHVEGLQLGKLKELLASFRVGNQILLEVKVL